MVPVTEALEYPLLTLVDPTGVVLKPHIKTWPKMLCICRTGRPDVPEALQGSMNKRRRVKGRLHGEGNKWNGGSHCYLGKGSGTLYQVGESL